MGISGIVLSKKEESAFFELLKAGIWGSEIKHLCPFPLSQDEWLNIYRFSCAQTVQGIVFKGLDYLPNNFFPPENLTARWLAENLKIENYNIKTNKEIIGLYELFGSYNILPILKKGLSVAALYQYPLSRVSGDIDLYFPVKDNLLLANSIIRDKGIRIQHHKHDGSYAYIWHNIPVEHHIMLTDLRNPFKNGYLHKLETEKGYEYMNITHAGKTINVPVPSPLLNILMLNIHIMSHVFLIGIGLRQLCDIALAYYRFLGEYDGEELRHVYKNIGILKWSALLHSFLITYLGLPKECIPYNEEKVSPVLLHQNIMQSGNFGQNLPGHTRAMRSVLIEKMYTIKILYQNRKITLRYAPFEALCWFIARTYGQFE
jgi:hypothetical protein